MGEWRPYAVQLHLDWRRRRAISPRDGWSRPRGSWSISKTRVDDLNNLLSYNKIFIERTAEVGILTAEKAISYGVTGPNLRASGVQWDLRRNDPYSIYDRFDFDIPIGVETHGPLGSCWNRYMVRVWEIEQSMKIIRQGIATICLPEMSRKRSRNA